MNTLDVLLKHCFVRKTLSAVLANTRTICVAHRLQMVLVGFDGCEFFTASLAHRLDNWFLLMRLYMRQILLVSRHRVSAFLTNVRILFRVILPIVANTILDRCAILFATIETKARMKFVMNRKCFPFVIAEISWQMENRA